MLCTIAVLSLYESTSYVFSPLPDGVFLPCDHGLDFYTINLSENSIIQPKHFFHLTTVHHLAFSRFTATLNQGLPLLFIKFSIRIGCQSEKFTFYTLANPALGLLNWKIRSNIKSLAA